MAQFSTGATGLAFDRRRQADVETFRDTLADKGYAVSYQAQILGLIRRIYKFARRRDWVGKDPTNEIHPKKPAGSQEAPFTIDNCFQKGTPVSWELAMAVADRLRPMFQVAFWIQVICGLRVGEVFGLTLADWYPDQAVVVVSRQAGGSYATGPDGEVSHEKDAPKTRAGRRGIPVPEQLAQILDRTIAEHHKGAPPDTRLIVNPRGGKTYAAYAEELADALAAENILNERGKPATSHYLRKVTVTNLFRAEADGRVVSRLVGHDATVAGASRVTSSVYYLGITAEEARAEVAKLERQMLEAGLTDLTPSPSNNDDYMTIEEAASTLKRSVETIRRWEREGLIASQLRRPSLTSPARSMVPRLQVEALLDNHADRYSLSDAALTLGRDAQSVIAAAKQLGVRWHRSADTTRCWFSAEDFRTLLTAIAEWEEFRATHLTQGEAAIRLETSPIKVRQMVRSGVLPAVEGPRLTLEVGGSPMWFRATEIEKLAAAPRKTWHRTTANPQVAMGGLTVEQAASQLNRCVPTVRSLLKKGELKALANVGGQRVWIEPASVAAYQRRLARRRTRGAE